MHITDGLLLVSLDFYPKNVVYSTPNFLDKNLLQYFLLLHQMTPLHLAAKIGRIKILDYIVKQGADINIQDDEGVNILCHHTYHCC